MYGKEGLQMLTLSQQSHRPVDHGTGEWRPKFEEAGRGGKHWFTGTPAAGAAIGGGSGGADGGADAFILNME